MCVTAGRALSERSICGAIKRPTGNVISFVPFVNDPLQESQFLLCVLLLNTMLTVSSDLLRRHLARHDMPTAPDPRRGRACDTCHANKTKCDGGKKCTLCLKRGINCTYKHASKSSSGSKSPTDNAPEPRAKRPTPNSTGSQDAVPSITLNVTPGPPQISPIDEVKAGFKRIANHIQSGEIPIGEDTPVPPLDQKWLERNSKDYFGRFHDTWPLLHGPSYKGNENSLLLTTTVAMISCWLKSSDEFGEVVLQLHEAFMNASSEWIVSFALEF